MRQADDLFADDEVSCSLAPERRLGACPSGCSISSCYFPCVISSRSPTAFCYAMPDSMSLATRCCGWRCLEPYSSPSAYGASDASSSNRLMSNGFRTRSSVIPFTIRGIHSTWEYDRSVGHTQGIVPYAELSHTAYCGRGTEHRNHPE